MRKKKKKLKINEKQNKQKAKKKKKKKSSCIYCIVFCAPICLYLGLSNLVISLKILKSSYNV